MINAVAGGGSLLTFPALLFAGLAPVTANVTNTVALLPGQFSAVFSYRREIAEQAHRALALAAIAAAGGLIGSVILLASPARVFRGLVPFLILLACGLLVAQPWLNRSLPHWSREGGRGSPWLYAVIFAVAVYGGYFGAGIGIMMISILTIGFTGGIRELNPVKVVLQLTIGIVSALYFIFFGPVVWGLVGLTAVASVAGGITGVVVARRLDPTLMRWAVVVYGVAVAIRLFF